MDTPRVGGFLSPLPLPGLVIPNTLRQAGSSSYLQNSKHRKMRGEFVTVEPCSANV